MSVIVVGKLNVDPASMQKLWNNRKDDLEAVRGEAVAAGALHHRWALGDGFAVFIDEWPDAASFQNFFQTNSTIPGLMQEAGVQGPPELTIAEFATGPDEF